VESSPNDQAQNTQAQSSPGRGSEAQRPRLMYVVTSPRTVSPLRGQLRYMAAAGFDVTVVSAPGRELDAAEERDGLTAIPIAMERDLSPVADWRAFLALRRLMKQRKPHITNVSTTKAGLLGGLAARATGVPVRVYVLRGIRYETATGVRRWLMQCAERMACACANRALCVSESVRKRLELQGLLTPEGSAVLASGSSNGVEAERFSPTGDRVAHAKRLRHELDIAEDALVVGYVGKLTSDKGLPELVAAHDILKRVVTGSRLLVIGGTEDGGGPLPAETREQLQSDRTIVCTGFVPDVAPYYHVMDVLALPTHSEGFPNTVLEAYAAGKPVVATRATGAIDAVMDEGTGILVPVGNVVELAAALESLLKSPVTRNEMGDAGRRWVLRDFRPVRIWRELEKEYRRLLEARGLPLPARQPVTTGFLEADFIKAKQQEAER
nr:glycosyltransferase family 4 protein [Acidobacteriota bacterium]